VALALYRKYRPRTFSEVIGQEHVTEPLAQALRSGRLHHAYLFSGPRGCGKTSSARILARSLNCEKGPTPEPCGVCDSCAALAPDGSGSIDVIEIDAASHGGVDDARELRERAFFAPVSSRFKVYVIDEAHMVSPAGFNALLKLVEEPPEYVKFVFATTEPEKVLGTIKSRTHHYPFRLIPPGTLRPYLEQLCVSEGVTVDPAVFPLVVRAGGGSARDSLSVLDQLIAGAGDDGVSYARAVALLGVTDAALLDEMCDALAATDGAAMYGAIDRVMEAGHDPRRFASDLLERFRDLIVLQQVPDAAAKGLLDFPQDQLERMAAQSNRIGAATLTRAAGLVHDGLTEMRGTTAPRLLLELISARMLLPGADDSTGALLQRLERLERRLTASDIPGEHPVPPAAAPPRQAPVRVVEAAAPVAVPAGALPVAAPVSAPSQGPAPVAPPSPPQAVVRPPAQASAQPVQPGPAPEPQHDFTPAPAAAPGSLDAAAIRRVWDEVLISVRRSSQRAWAVVREATVRDVDGNTLVLLFQHQVHATMLANNTKVLSDAVAQLVGGTWQVRCEVGGSSGGDGGAPGAVRQPRPPSGPTPAPAAQPADRPAPPEVEAPAAFARPAPVQTAPAQAPPAQAAPDPAAQAQAAPDSASGPAVHAASGSTPYAAPGSAAPAHAAPDSASGPAAHAASGSVPNAAASAPPTAAAVRGVDGGNGRAGTPGVGTSSGVPAEEDGWPVAAVPGGRPGQAAPVAPPAEEEWPAAAVPGGRSAAAAVAASVAAPVQPAFGVPTKGVPAKAVPAKAVPGKQGRPVSGAAEAARAAAAAARSALNTRATTVRQPDAAPAQTWDEEPPYDPEYDGATPPDRKYPGFDPGDEPLDDDGDSPATPRESSEELALRLLREHLGAERID
jgi:DNA polymerase-3 subunit gamma/tau